MRKEIEGIQSLKLAKRFTSFMKDSEKIQDMEKELARAMSLFHVGHVAFGLIYSLLNDLTLL